MTSWGTCHLVVPPLMTLRLSGGFRGSLSVWYLHRPSPNGFNTCWWSLPRSIVIVSLILHVLAGILTWRRLFLHQLLGFSNMRVVQERQNNACFSFYQSTFRVMIWYPSLYPNCQYGPMSFIYFSFFNIYIIVNAWILYIWFAMTLPFDSHDSLYSFLCSQCLILHYWESLQISSWVL